jgi:hypothetical protein
MRILLYRDNNVLYHTIIFCTSYIFPAVSDSKWPPDIPPVFPWTKEAEAYPRSLVKEMVLNNKVEGPEQRGCSLLQEMSVKPPIVRLS